MIEIKRRSFSKNITNALNIFSSQCIREIAFGVMSWMNLKTSFHVDFLIRLLNRIKNKLQLSESKNAKQNTDIRIFFFF